ncbi:uncharacterized protein BO97DRAFT_462444, partial [Aspergillus homomorphus CBS 101889]
TRNKTPNVVGQASITLSTESINHTQFPLPGRTTSAATDHQISDLQNSPFNDIVSASTHFKMDVKVENIVAMGERGDYTASDVDPSICTSHDAPDPAEDYVADGKSKLVSHTDRYSVSRIHIGSTVLTAVIWYGEEPIVWNDEPLRVLHAESESLREAHPDAARFHGYIQYDEEVRLYCEGPKGFKYSGKETFHEKDDRHFLVNWTQNKVLGLDTRCADVEEEGDSSVTGPRTLEIAA